MASSMRQAIARYMTHSKQHIPHYYLTMRAEMSAALDRREEWNLAHAKDDAVSVNDLVLKAAALALAAHPEFNGHYQDDEFRGQPHINLGMAVALDDGLIAPAVLHCEALTIVQLARQARELAARARRQVLSADEYTGGTFTVTNLGMFGVDSFAAIIVPPQVGIMAVGAAIPTPVLIDGELATARLMALTLSGDHRATDGAEGARFLADLVQHLQHPDALFAGV